MKQLTLDNCFDSSVQEQKKIETLLNKHDKSLHFLALDKTFEGFSPLNSFVGNYPDIKEKEQEIFNSLIEKQEVCSLYPRLNLTLYPIRIIDMKDMNWN